MKNVLLLPIFLFISIHIGSAQFIPNFYIGNVVSITTNYNSAWITNNKQDKTIKHSILITAEGGDISAIFVLYFGENTYEAEANSPIPNVYNVKSWHHISEYDRIYQMLSSDSQLGIGFLNRIEEFPNRIKISRY
jgi:hypothetical protein